MNLGRVAESMGNSVTFSLFPLSSTQPDAMKYDEVDNQISEFRLCFLAECEASEVWPVGSGCAGTDREWGYLWNLAHYRRATASLFESCNVFATTS